MLSALLTVALAVRSPCDHIRPNHRLDPGTVMANGTPACIRVGYGPYGTRYGRALFHGAWGASSAPYESELACIQQPARAVPQSAAAARRRRRSHQFAKCGVRRKAT